MRIRNAAVSHAADKRNIARLLGAVALVIGMFAAAGCGDATRTEVESPTVDTPTGPSASGNDSPATPASDTPTAAVDGADELDLSTIDDWYLPSLPGVSSDELINASVTATFRSASTDGDKLYTSYDPYDFPEDGGTDAVVYFFYERSGRIVGGKFDYWRSGGQGTKTLENVHDGYGGHKMPSSGTLCWTMISSKDGSQRSNTVLVTWK